MSRPSTFRLISGPVEMPTRNWQPLFQCVDLDHGVDHECTEHQANESYQGYQGPHQNSEGSNCRPRKPERFSLVIADLAEQLTHFPVRRRWIHHGDSEFLYVSVPSRNVQRQGSGGGDGKTQPLATNLTPARLHPLVNWRFVFLRAARSRTITRCSFSVEDDVHDRRVFVIRPQAEKRRHQGD